LYFENVGAEEIEYIKYFCNALRESVIAKVETIIERSK